MKALKDSLILRSVSSVPSCDLIQHFSISAVKRADFVTESIDCSRPQLCAFGHLVRLGVSLDTFVNGVKCLGALSSLVGTYMV